MCHPTMLKRLSRSPRRTNSTDHRTLIGVLDSHCRPGVAISRQWLSSFQQFPVVRDWTESSGPRPAAPQHKARQAMQGWGEATQGPQYFGCC